jgi:hypothetical protein
VSWAKQPTDLNNRFNRRWAQRKTIRAVRPGVVDQILVPRVWTRWPTQGRVLAMLGGVAALELGLKGTPRCHRLARRWPPLARELTFPALP